MRQREQFFFTAHPAATLENVSFPRAPAFGSDMAAKGGRPALRLRYREHCAPPNAGCGWGDAGSRRLGVPPPSLPAATLDLILLHDGVRRHSNLVR
eukprot:2791341-Prymnesium_polylepis.1